jgi:glycosyltransferase involved in cell wall biosynthesis
MTHIPGFPASDGALPILQAPLATIILVNHNYGQFIDRCIRSVDQQDYSNVQCIVLDCASTDNSPSVIEEAVGRATKPVFQVIRRSVNEGHLINALAALEHAQGAFLTFLDADDFLFPEFISTHIKAHLNDVNSAALSVTDQVQVDSDERVIAGTCHWHQKWRASEHGTAWTRLSGARSWNANSPAGVLHMDEPNGLSYVPAWWSSWVIDRWIWSTTSALMFRKSVVESLTPTTEQFSAMRPNFGLDAYLARFAHSVGGTLVVDSTQGAYRRHGQNIWSNNQVFGGQTPNATRTDVVSRFGNIQRLARQTLTTKYQELLRQFGGELYYSIAWQLMSNQDFLEFTKAHQEDQAIWDKTLETVGAAKHRAHS